MLSLLPVPSYYQPPLSTNPQPINPLPSHDPSISPFSLPTQNKTEMPPMFTPSTAKSSQSRQRHKAAPQDPFISLPSAHISTTPERDDLTRILYTGTRLTSIAPNCESDKNPEAKGGETPAKLRPTPYPLPPREPCPRLASIPGYDQLHNPQGKICAG